MEPSETYEMNEACVGDDYTPETKRNVFSRLKRKCPQNQKSMYP